MKLRIASIKQPSGEPERKPAQCFRTQLEQLGIHKALEQATSSGDRRCIEAVHAVMTDEDGTPNFVHAGFAMTALPHKRIEDREWVRDGADIRLRIESGKTHDGTSVGMPFGYVARLILLYLQTEAIKTQSREVELGRSMHSGLKAMNSTAAARATRQSGNRAAD